nr:VOC family protein [Chthoniobacterales bacterium]
KHEDYRRPPTPDETPGHDDVTLYFNCPDVDAAYEHVIANGVKIRAPEVMHYGMKQMTIRDPDGFDLCFQQPVAIA